MTHRSTPTCSRRWPSPWFRRTAPIGAAEIVFEQGIEYSNPDGQHLQLNLARPGRPTGEGSRRRALHSRRRISGRQPRSLEQAVPAVGRARLRGRDRQLSARADVPVSGRGPRRQSGGPLAAGQCGEVRHRPRSDRHGGRFGRRTLGAVPGRHGRRARNSKAMAATPSSRAPSPAS